MSLRNEHLDRGKIGNTPALLTRADETYEDFMRDTRNLLLKEPFKKVSKRAEEAFKERGIELGLTDECVEQVRAVVRDEPDLATFLRVKRSCQEVYKNRIIESYNLQQDDFLRKLDDAENQGPGTLSYDPSFDYPPYSTVEIHIQPGGYVGHPLAGLYYDYGTSVFFGDGGVADGLQKKLAGKTTLPKDGKVERILEIGCSIGQLTCELKNRFPEAEVYGTDIASPMLRYAHWRAVEQDIDVHFAQMPGEDMDFDSNSFDLIVTHLLFHEIPVPVIKGTLSEIHRLLRPGGTFVMWDFPTATKESPGYAGFAGLMDAVDNCEPYAYGFVTCKVEELIAGAGLELRSNAPADMTTNGRVCDKPT